MTDYYYYKSHGICVSCRKNDAEPHSIYCWDCREKSRARARKQYRKNKVNPYFRHYKNSQTRLRQERLKEEGLCTCCGQVKAMPGKTLCQRCLDRKKEKGGGISFQLRKYLGICLRCSQPVAKGYSLCERHLEIQRNILARVKKQLKG
jgi:hypothetical protein